MRNTVTEHTGSVELRPLTGPRSAVPRHHLRLAKQIVCSRCRAPGLLVSWQLLLLHCGNAEKEAPAAQPPGGPAPTCCPKPTWVWGPWGDSSRLVPS